MGLAAAKEIGFGDKFGLTEKGKISEELSHPYSAFHLKDTKSWCAGSRPSTITTWGGLYFGVASDVAKGANPSAEPKINDATSGPPR